jgi:hypothetical protein
MADEIAPNEIPAALTDRMISAYEDVVIKGGNMTESVARDVLAAVLPLFDKTIRAEIVRWIEAQMVKCPHGHDRDTGHRAQCNWCWHNAALIGAARLARGDHGSRTAYALHRMVEAEAAAS